MEQQTPTYNPSVSYRWEPKDNFTFSGAEFGFLFNQLIKEKAELLAKIDAITIMETKLKAAVESGIAKPIEQTPKD